MSEQDDRNRFNTSSIDKATADRPASDSGFHPDTSAPKNISADDGAAKETLNILPTQNADAKNARTGADSRPHRTQSSSDNTLVNGKVHPVTRASAHPADEEAGDLENTTKVYDIVHTTAEEQKKETAQLLKKRRKQKRLTIWAAILVVIVCINIIIATAGIIVVQKMVANSPALNVSDFVGEESSKIYDSKGNMVSTQPSWNPPFFTFPFRTASMAFPTQWLWGNFGQMFLYSSSETNYYNILQMLGMPRRLA